MRRTQWRKVCIDWLFSDKLSTRHIFPGLVPLPARRWTMDHLRFRFFPSLIWIPVPRTRKVVLTTLFKSIKLMLNALGFNSAECTGVLESPEQNSQERGSSGIAVCFGGSDDKEFTFNAEDPGSIPGSGRFLGGGNGSPLQYSCLGNPTDRRAWLAIVHGMAKSQTGLHN